MSRLDPVSNLHSSLPGSLIVHTADADKTKLSCNNDDDDDDDDDDDEIAYFTVRCKSKKPV